MIALSRLYHPVTGTPFQRDETYREVAPRATLAPFIRCFWGSEGPQHDRPAPDGIVIPDTCMDVIFHIDHIVQRVTATFCALDETSALTTATSGGSGYAMTFGIRFYAWTACLFSEDDLRGSLNGRYPAEQFFPAIVRALSPVLPDMTSLESAIHAAEPLLLRCLHADRADPAVLNAVDRFGYTDQAHLLSDFRRRHLMTPREALAFAHR